MPLAEDKENFCPADYCNQSSTTLRGNSKRSAGAFGKLLDDACKEVKESNEYEDAKYAMGVQCRDITNVVDDLYEEMEREEADEKMAIELYKSEKKSMQDMKKSQDIQEMKDGSTALQYAIEERRRINEKAQQKKEMEAKDVEYAKKSILDDVDETFKMEKICSKDAEYALKVKAELQDEMYASEIAERELNEMERRRSEKEARHDADQKLAEEEQAKIERELSEEDAKLMQQDFHYAREVLSNIDTHYVRNKENQEREDASYAKKLMTASARTLQEKQKSQKLLSNINMFNLEAIAAQWEDAEAEVDDVMGGLCITVLLPHLADLTVDLADTNTIRIAAKRMILKGDKTATRNNKMYVAEFDICGNKISISAKDLNYSYQSEVGVLHVYVENIHLDSQLACEREQNVESSTNSVLSSVKRSFTRLFNRK